MLINIDVYFYFKQVECSTYHWRKRMKTLQKTLLALTATVAMASGANAAISYSTAQPYVGVKAGQFDSDVKGVGNIDKSTAYGVYGGLQFTPNWGVEAEYLGSDKADVTASGVKTGEIDTKTYGVYGTYNYNFVNSPIYAKAKLGLAKTEVESKTATRTVSAEVESKTATRTVSTDDTGLAYGLGLGFQATPAIALEAEYAKPGADTKLWTIGAKVKF